MQIVSPSTFRLARLEIGEGVSDPKTDVGKIQSGVARMVIVPFGCGTSHGGDGTVPGGAAMYTRAVRASDHRAWDMMALVVTPREARVAAQPLRQLCQGVEGRCALVQRIAQAADKYSGVVLPSSGQWIRHAHQAVGNQGNSRSAVWGFPGCCLRHGNLMVADNLVADVPEPVEWMWISECLMAAASDTLRARLKAKTALAKTPQSSGEAQTPAMAFQMVGKDHTRVGGLVRILSAVALSFQSLVGKS